MNADEVNDLKKQVDYKTDENLRDGILRNKFTCVFVTDEQ